VDIDASLTGTASAPAKEEPEPAAEEIDDETQAELRRLSLELGNNYRGTSGVLRVSEAYSGAPGTFRISFLAGISQAKGFLCDGTAEGGCDTLDPGNPGEDEMHRVSGELGLSMTLTSFLEAFSTAHGGDLEPPGRPELSCARRHQGAQGFLPTGRPILASGEVELWQFTHRRVVASTAIGNELREAGPELGRSDQPRPGRGSSPVPALVNLATSSTTRASW
jgi:hypothetical protein